MSGLHIQHKREFHLFRWLLLLAVLALLGAYAYYGFRWFKTGELSPLPLPVAAADGKVDETKLSRQKIDAYTVAKNEPRYLLMDDFLVKARVQKSGLGSRKMFTMPNSLDDVVWYEKSAAPSGKSYGAAVIVGRNTGISRDGTFSKLKKLKNRDVIKVERGDGQVIKYEVRDIKEQPLAEFNKTGMTEAMISMDNTKEGLSLVADSGKWIPSQNEFDSRIIVRAVAVK